MHRFVSLDVDRDHTRVLDLCQRASDYIRLETGKDPDAKYVSDTLTDAPPQLTPDDIFLLGIERSDGQLAGLGTYIRHFYQRDEWYMGLLVLDPLERGQNLGRRTVEHVLEHARSKGGTLIRIAVLDANPRGRKFWETMGFGVERSVPADQNEDGHARHVLRRPL